MKRKVGPYTSDDTLPPMRLLSQHIKPSSPNPGGGRFLKAVLVAAIIAWMAYTGVAEYCRFKNVIGFPSTHCTCTN